MKCSFQKSDLISGINIALKAVPSRTTMPILECILIDASSGQIHLMSNDMELAVDTVVEGTISEPGKTAVDAKLFSEIVRRLPESQVMIESDENELMRITCEKTHFNISGKEGEEFVEFPHVEKGDYICLSQFTLKEVIRQTIFSIAVNETNKLMTGELFEIKENRLRVVSLDGHRIAVRNVELRDTYASKKVVVPGKTLTEISRILPGESGEDVYIFFGKNHILFEFGQTLVASRLIEGEYFRVDQMISGSYETKMTVNKKELLDSIERSILLVRESDKKPIVMNVRDDNLTLSLNSVIGSMREDLDIELNGKNLTIAFNPRFIQDALRVIDDEKVDIYMINAKAPCFIRDENQSYVYLILPVNFQSTRS